MTSAPSATVWRLLLARALRGFADGVVSVSLAGYLITIGFSPVQVSAVVTGTLLGSAALTLAAGLAGHRLAGRTALLWACLLMFFTGAGFAGVTAFWPLLLVAVAGTLNPSAGDVSVFLPVEQAMLAGAAPASRRTALFARYNLSGTFAAAFGALASGLPVVLAERYGWERAAALRSGFVLYTLVAMAAALVYRGLPAGTPERDTGPRTPLARSRRVVLQLAALFSLDSLGGGLVIQSLLVLWLYLRFGLAEETAGVIFFAGSLLTACSQLLAARLAARIGLVNTMVFTHLPANLLLVLAAFAPSAPLAVALLLLRFAFSSMDVPARQSLVMSAVPPEERAAAASVTNVPRSLAAAATPLLAGLLLERTSFGWPLVIAGALKAAYDLLLWRFARHPASGLR